MPDMNDFSRRGFIKASVALAGAAAIRPAFAADAPAGKRTAADQVPLGKTGLMISRVGIGTGSNNGHVQRDMGKEQFTDLIHYCFDQGITYIDCAQAYATFDWIADATKGLPRDKLFLQSKVPGQPADILATIDRHRSVFNTDYIDSLLVHCMTRPGWTDEWKRIMDGFNEAKEKKWIKAKGVSCHTYPALVAGNKIPWTEVHLVRVNPQGKFMDADAPKEQPGRIPIEIEPILAEIKSMSDKGRGVIGMKICGNGTFTDPAEREKSIRFAMNNPHIHCVVIGMKSRAEVDENIRMINKALAA